MTRRAAHPRGASAVACMACAVLALELALTRIASSVLQFQLTFIVITLSLTGLGVGALLAARPHDGWSPLLTGPAFAPVTLAVIQALPVVVHLQGTQYWLTGLVLVPPFVLAGHFITTTFRASPGQAGVLYAADLAGAATGCLLAGTAMNTLGPVPTARLAALVGAASGLASLRGLAAGGGRMTVGGFGAALFPVLFLPALGLPTVSFSSRPSLSTQPFIAEAKDRRDVVRTYWDAFARTDVVRDPESPDRLEIYTNGNVPSAMYRVPTPLSASTGPTAARAALEAGGLPGTAALPFLMAPPGQVLSVGPGGGLDLLAGRAPGDPAGRLRRRRLLLAAGCTGAGFMIFELQTIGGLVRAIVGIGWAWQVGGGCFALAAALGAARSPTVRSVPRVRASRRWPIAG